MYNPTKWEDHVSDPQNEFILEKIEGNRYKITPCGEIVQKGTLLSAENFNKNERGTAETVIALCTLLQMANLNKDELLNLSNLFIVSKEYTVDTSSFSVSIAAYSKCEFPAAYTRKNTDYTVIPVITNVEVYSLGDSKYTGLDQVGLPVVYADEKTTTGFRINYLCPDRESDFKSMSFKFLVIGGV
ncbi:MAG: hypothetical protein IJZ89_07810 [Clostridia bacterium]|nr:hypothetical protein [Clostridia bacterium]